MLDAVGRTSTVVFFSIILLQVPAVAAHCGRLTTLQLPNTAITAAEDVAAGKFVPPDEKPSDQQLAGYRALPAFCRVHGVIQPSADSHIEFEIWLPASNWNKRYMGVGNAGSGGYINYGSNVHSLTTGLRDGFAASSTDTGHRGADDDFSFARGHREKRIDYHYRAIHETALAAKAIIRAFYGAAPKYSYFAGGSDGGRQALMEAQRYPADYDGILAMAPALNRTGSVMAQTWVAQAVARANGDIPQRVLSLVEAATIAACDALDGVKDGIISDPLSCHFDPASLLCKDAGSERCLTAAQVDVFKRFYSGPQNSKGEHVAPRFLPGAETDPGGVLSCTSCKTSGFHRADIFFKDTFDSQFKVETFDFDRDVESLENTEDARLTKATNLNLKAFKDRGGKLIITHGWSDGADPAMASVDYYQRVVSTIGAKVADTFLRLYMVPGVYHNMARGTGPTVFQDQMLTALERWVETGASPGEIIATKYKIDGNADSGVARTRPLCPYPQAAKYKGSGSIDDAKNFSCMRGLGE